MDSVFSPLQIHPQEKAFSVQFSGLYMFETDVHGKPTAQDFVEDPGQLEAPFSLDAARLQNQIQSLKDAGSVDLSLFSRRVSVSSATGQFSAVFSRWFVSPLPPYTVRRQSARRWRWRWRCWRGSSRDHLADEAYRRQWS